MGSSLSLVWGGSFVLLGFIVAVDFFRYHRHTVSAPSANKASPENVNQTTQDANEPIEQRSAGIHTPAIRTLGAATTAEP